MIGVRGNAIDIDAYGQGVQAPYFTADAIMAAAARNQHLT
eukprot:SAG31_NODE_15284_length_762_cov_1.473605_1_plen_39_part_10